MIAENEIIAAIEAGNQGAYGDVAQDSTQTNSIDDSWPVPLQTTQAVGADTVYAVINGKQFTASSPYFLNGNRSGAGPNNYNAYYDVSTSTLYLKDCIISEASTYRNSKGGSFGYHGIFIEKDTTIILQGDSTIALTGYSDLDSLKGIYALGSITFGGEGQLTIDYSDSNSGDLKFNGITTNSDFIINSGTLCFVGSTSSTESYGGIFVIDASVIVNGGNIRFSPAATGMITGIVCSSFYMSDGTLNILAASTNGESSYALFCWSSLSILGGQAYFAGFSNSAHGIYQASSNYHGPVSTAITGGQVTVIGSTKAFSEDVEDISLSLDTKKEQFIYVNTEASADGASLWNGQTPLGGKNTPYQYIVFSTVEKVWKPAQYAWQDDVAIFEDDNKNIGLINKRNQILMEPMDLDSISPFFEGLALIEQNGKYGFINHQGDVVIPLLYDDANAFSDGLALVRQNGRYGYVDKTGNMIISSQWINAKSFSEGLAAVGNSYWGYIDKKGNYVIDPIWDYASTFSGGIAVVKSMSGSSSDYQYINNDGEILNVVIREGLYSFEQDEKYGFKNNDGQIVIKPSFYSVGQFSEGLASYLSAFESYGFIDTNGKVVIQPRYEAVGSFSEGMAAVSVDGNYGYINQKGDIVIEPQWDFASSFSQGVAYVSKDNIHWYINSEGEPITPGF